MALVLVLRWALVLELALALSLALLLAHESAMAPSLASPFRFSLPDLLLARALAVRDTDAGDDNSGGASGENSRIRCSSTAVRNTGIENMKAAASVPLVDLPLDTATFVSDADANRVELMAPELSSAPE